MLPLTKRQREILDYLNDFIQQHGYAPSLEEIGRRFGLSSLATVHKHLTNLQKKGLVKRDWNRSRALELVPTQVTVKALELPLLGRVAAGSPIEAISASETIFVPEDMVGRRETYVLQVKGDSMIEEQIRDGDYVIVENRRTARDGEMVIALLDGENVWDPPPRQRPVDERELRDLAARGWEIGSHSLTHAHLTEVDPGTLRTEVAGLTITSGRGCAAASAWRQRRPWSG